MLEQLTIKNVAVIDRLEVEPGAGLCVLTGETGAGKSVIIGSILYKACVAAAVHFLTNASDMKLITAALFLVILVISMDKKRKVASEDA